jgi:3-oxoacyl-[acyl-carrier-protein] synthase II
LGCVTALGESVDELFAALCEGKSGISNIESFDVNEYPVKFGGEIKGFEAAGLISQKKNPFELALSLGQA